MSTTLERVRTNGNGGREDAAAKTSRWGPRGKSDPVCVAVARRLGIAPKTAEHRLRELPREVIAFIEEFQDQGAELRLRRFTQLMVAALERRVAPPLCDATFDLSQRADSAEEIAETCYNRNPSDVNLDRLIRASEDEQRYGEARLLALFVERDRRRRERT